MTVPYPAAWQGILAELIDAAHFVGPAGLARIVEDTCAGAGIGVTIHLVDHEQERLRTLTRDLADDPDAVAPDPLPVGASIAGRAFMTLTPVPTAGDPPTLWMPIVNGTERIGVLEIRLPSGASPTDAANSSAWTPFAVGSP